ncbi:MAG: ABC transporter substrate-binding protein [Anaerolineae bacterium]|nr:ABC transporter substrate-binding protein [Anaerolineales bacterium]MCQ3973852.1 ABC transporter substrate-binding protein [Anaerolineae bacterium]
MKKATLQDALALSRREFLKLSAGTVAALSLAGCAVGGGSSAGRAIKIGYVTPKTGPLAPFGEADDFVLSQMTKFFEGGIDAAGAKHPLEIVTKDSQSDPNRAAEVAADLILKDKVDIVLVSSTPETTNPVSDQCEANGVPCISTVAPWQPWFFRKQDAAEKGYQWTYHYFWGLEDIIGVFLDIWNSLDTNKVVGGLWPNDGDGLAWSSPEVGFPPALEKAGYKVVDPGRYENLKDDFSAEIAAFKEAGVEIVTGVMIPPDLGTFLTQASQQGFNPKAFTVGKAALFPVVVESLPDNLGQGLTTEIWWTPNHPFKSSLTGQSAKELTDAYTAASSKQWTQPIGFAHSLFEVAADVLKRTTDIDNPEAIVEAIKATNLDTIVGKISWSGGPFPNVAKTPLVGGQWQKGDKNPFDLVIGTNTAATNIPTAGSIEAKAWP